MGHNDLDGYYVKENGNNNLLFEQIFQLFPPMSGQTPYHPWLGVDK